MLLQLARVIVPAMLAAIFGWLLVQQIRAGDVAVRNVGFQRDSNPAGFWSAVILWALGVTVLVYLSVASLLRLFEISN